MKDQHVFVLMGLSGRDGEKSAAIGEREENSWKTVSKSTKEYGLSACTEGLVLARGTDGSCIATGGRVVRACRWVQLLMGIQVAATQQITSPFQRKESFMGSEDEQHTAGRGRREGSMFKRMEEKMNR